MVGVGSRVGHRIRVGIFGIGGLPPHDRSTAPLSPWLSPSMERKTISFRLDYDVINIHGGVIWLTRLIFSQGRGGDGFFWILFSSPRRDPGQVFLSPWSKSVVMGDGQKQSYILILTTNPCGRPFPHNDGPLLSHGTIFYWWPVDTAS